MSAATSESTVEALKRGATFMSAVKERFQGQGKQESFDAFVKLMLDLKAQSKSLEDILGDARELFREDPDLLETFQTFLPSEVEATKQSSKEGNSGDKPFREYRNPSLSSSAPLGVIALAEAGVVEALVKGLGFESEAALGDEKNASKLKQARKRVRNAHAIHAAAAKGKTSLVAWALEAELEEVNRPDEESRTLLHWAAWQGHAETCRMLIENGALINARTTSGFTPLHYAASSNSLETVKTLLGLGANFEATNERRETPLATAESLNKSEIVKYLTEYVEKGHLLDVNAKKLREEALTMESGGGLQAGELERTSLEEEEAVETSNLSKIVDAATRPSQAHMVRKDDHQDKAGGRSAASFMESNLARGALAFGMFALAVAAGASLTLMAVNARSSRD